VSVTLTFRPIDDLENTIVVECDSSARNNVSPEGYPAQACAQSPPILNPNPSGMPILATKNRPIGPIIPGSFMPIDDMRLRI
jgi:hypothetical protein